LVVVVVMMTNESFQQQLSSQYLIDGFGFGFGFGFLRLRLCLCVVCSRYMKTVFRYSLCQLHAHIHLELII
jgi:hypothetical protein